MSPAGAPALDLSTPSNAPVRPPDNLLGARLAMTRLLAALAADVRDATQRPDLAFCDAPGCDQMFYRRRTNQAWCGNRARVARHQTG